MGLKKIILNLILYTMHLFRFLMPVRKNRITFISITQDHPTYDFKLLYDALKKEDKYDIRLNLVLYEHSLKADFLYLFNCMRQLYELHTSRMVIINDNNYVVTKFKRSSTNVLQLWHAAGAVKQFGNQIKREYPIQSYDFVLANAPVWIKPYQEAFGVGEDAIKVTGMPRLDRLCNQHQRLSYQKAFYKKYPHLKGKQIILYAPTFRGNIIDGLWHEGLDMEDLIQQLPEDTVLLYKLHPLLKGAKFPEQARLINVFDESLYMLMCVSTALISDYSSILFDYALLNKKIICYAPDMESYGKTIGFNIDYVNDMPCPICMLQEDVLQECLQLQAFNAKRLKGFRDRFMTYHDGKNTLRVLRLIHDIMK